MAALVISYSRADQALVRAVVSLLQTALRDIDKAVFWDGQLDPGDSWFEQLKIHIDGAPQLFVFWCDHSSVSEEVKREFTYAFARRKRVVPVLLDDTPLVDELAPIHGIDLRGAVHHPRKSALAAGVAATKGFRPRRIAAVLAVAVASVCLTLWMFLPKASHPVGSVNTTAGSPQAEPTAAPEPPVPDQQHAEVPGTSPNELRIANSKTPIVTSDPAIRAALDLFADRITNSGFRHVRVLSPRNSYRNARRVSQYLESTYSLQVEISISQSAQGLVLEGYDPRTMASGGSGQVDPKVRPVPPSVTKIPEPPPSPMPTAGPTVTPDKKVPAPPMPTPDALAEILYNFGLSLLLVVITLSGVASIIAWRRIVRLTKRRAIVSQFARELAGQ